MVRSGALGRAGDPFDALGDAQRRTILRLLGEQARSVGELAGSMTISRPAVSRHLRVLREAGLVREEPRGTRRIYAIQDAGIDAVRAYLEQVWGDAATRFRLAAETTTERRAAGTAGLLGVDGRDRARVAAVAPMERPGANATRAAGRPCCHKMSR